MAGRQVMQDEKRDDTSRKALLRLPMILPKDDISFSASSSGQHTTGSAIAFRARLPPRSKTGCWTCRSRKVKCDEGRPVCDQCTRLGHNCDYGFRCSFRYNTQRVVQLMQEVSIVGNSIWDSDSPATTEAGAGSVAVDDLPPFAQLVNDQDREKKAERSRPGTYHVIVNPDSFQHLPEYSDNDAMKRDRPPPFRRGSIATSLTSSLGKESSTESFLVLTDPNVVILPKFEDVATRQALKKKSSPSLRQTKTEQKDNRKSSKLESEANEERYIRQFRDVVWRQLVPAELDHLNGMEQSSVFIVENEAQLFPPLYHAIIALAALGMGRSDGEERLNALHHYQQAIPALQSTLRSAEDLSSNGAFLTHFLLLVYEISAAEAGHDNLWSQHLSTLLRITLLRREVFGGERYPFIVWWICTIDLDALFTGAGSGDYVGVMLKNDLIPPPSFHLYPRGMDGSSVVYKTELETLPTVLQLDFEVTILAIRLALLSQEFRKETTFGTGGSEQRDRDTRLRQFRIYDLQESLRQLWATYQVTIVCQKSDVLPFRSKRIFEHAYTLSRACIIYSHTSMWSTQRCDTSPECGTEIEVASSQILQMTSRILADGRLDCRFLVFPCFMAGYSSQVGDPKLKALDLIGRMDRISIGKNTAATKTALIKVYEKQTERFVTTGQSLDVDWMDVIREQKMLIVNFGL